MVRIGITQLARHRQSFVEVTPGRLAAHPVLEFVYVVILLIANLVDVVDQAGEITARRSAASHLLGLSRQAARFGHSIVSQSGVGFPDKPLAIGHLLYIRSGGTGWRALWRHGRRCIVPRRRVLVRPLGSLGRYFSRCARQNDNQEIAVLPQTQHGLLLAMIGLAG